jgi:hypothetical protein
MKLTIVTDGAGQVVAAMKAPDPVPRDGIGATIRPASPDHRLHEITLPARLESARIAEILRQVRIHDDGRAPDFPD